MRTYAPTPIGVNARIRWRSPATIDLSISMIPFMIGTLATNMIIFAIRYPFKSRVSLRFHNTKAKINGTRNIPAYRAPPLYLGSGMGNIQDSRVPRPFETTTNIVSPANNGLVSSRYSASKKTKAAISHNVGNHTISTQNPMHIKGYQIKPSISNLIAGSMYRASE